MTGRATATLTLAALVLAAVVVSPSAWAQPEERVPSELWSEYPLDPQKGEVPPPSVETVPAREPRPVRPATPPQDDGEELVASPIFWVLLLVLLLVGAVLAAAMGALAPALETLTAVPARLRARVPSSALRAAASAPIRFGRRAAAEAPQALSRLAAPAAALARPARRARRPLIAAPRQVERLRDEDRRRTEASIGDALVDRARAYVFPEAAPEAVERGAGGALERCEIRWWRGYVKSQFYAHGVTEEGLEFVVATSPMFLWRRATPPPPTKAAVAARIALVETLVARGWERDEPRLRAGATEAPWFAGTFRRRVLAVAGTPT